MLRSKQNGRRMGRWRERTEDDNQFLDDFLKLPLKIKQCQRKQAGKESPIKLQLSVPSRLPLPLQQTQANRQIKHILAEIKKEDDLRRQRTKQFMERVAAQKEEEKRLRQFKIAERKIKKRLMLLQRKEHITQELLSFANLHTPHTQPTADLRHYQTKSLDQAISNKAKHNPHPSPLPTRPLAPKHRQKKEVEQYHLPPISNCSAVTFRGKKRLSRISTVTLTKELRIEEDPPQKRDYLTELKRKRRNYTESNKELHRLYEEGASSAEKERAVELAAKIERKRRLRMKNPNEMDYRQAQSKIELLNFLHRHH